MLELRPSCEHCDRDLPPDSPQAWICTFECTFCSGCVTTVLQGVCPNCTGDLVHRPVRPRSALARHPASTVRIHRPVDLSAHARRLRAVGDAPPADR